MARSKKQDTRAYPVPEAIDGQPWHLRESQPRDAGMSAAHRHMQVPLGHSPAERMVRMHEMTHAKISPPEMEAVCLKIDEQVVQNCEDGRVHGQMQRLRFPVGEMAGVLSDIEVGRMAKESHLAHLAALGAAVNLTGEWERVHDAVESLGDRDRMAAYQFGTTLAQNRVVNPTELPEFEVTVQMAREIIDLFGDPSKPEPPPMNLPPGRYQTLAEAPAEVHGEIFGEMTLEEPPLPLRLPGQLKGRRKKTPDVRGRRLHRVGRLHIDGRVFANVLPRKGGGAVLIDTSGSMSLTTDEVLQLCLTYPAGVIGAYSGESEEYGTLRVIARNGRRVHDHDISPPGGGNCVDGPALDWLAEQPGPRWWISDAGVSGGPAGLKYCIDVCRRNNITRVDDAWEIVGRDV